MGVIVLSFMNWDGLATPTWVGLDNWRSTLAEPQTINAIKLSLVVMIVTWMIQTPVSLLLGVFMASQKRYREFLSVLYFLPLLFSSAALGIAFKALLDPNFGFSNAFGMAWLSQDWLGSSKLALPVVMVVIAWAFIPFHSLIYQGGVRQIPAVLYEAAELDGASGWQRFWHITIPQLKYTIVTDSTLQLVGGLTYFDLIYVLTSGGPGDSTRILPLHMYLLGFKSFDMGAASVVGTLLLVVGLALSLGLNKLSGASKMESQVQGL
ncbi:carbohydrate ABC transporter permease [Changpingibacter yushuensis]|uniref:carbohydrate ABC transporter permease n=1 Tax=Changpingibacter yushuensis TaxID=2758440 RepID=UPI0029350D00|nr:sugar ABC transporter permease [Changpingibacter yushuensis]